MESVVYLRVGDKVRYQPDHYDNNRWENGIVKEISEDFPDSVRVVYNCGGDWENYQNYTGALTQLRDLRIGWKN